MVVAAEEGRAGYIPRSGGVISDGSCAWDAPSAAGSRGVIFIGVVRAAAVGEPGHFCGDGGAGFEGVGEADTDVGGAADAGEEGGLEEAWDAEGGGDEDYAEGGMWADEKVLGWGC